MLCAALAGLAGGASGASSPQVPRAQGPKLTGVRCLAHCAGARRTTVDGQVRLSGRHLAGVTEVTFPGGAADVTTPPDETDRRRVLATVPEGATSGRPTVLTSSAATARARERLGIVDASELPDGFKLRKTSVRPGRAFFDQRGAIHARYEFEAAERTGVRIEVTRGSHTIRTWRHRDQLPFARASQAWNGVEGDGDAADDGRYRFRIGAFGKRSAGAGSVRLHSYRFPVRGPHGYGGAGERFGAPRSGGRVHQGQDVFAPCGTPLQAARGGRVQAKAYDPVLYGNYLVIDGRKTGADHMYVHMSSPSRLGDGDRVHTGDRVGSVGNSGNASGEGCQLHFEIWPDGWRNGSPVDPLPALRRWDGWS